MDSKRTTISSSISMCFLEVSLQSIVRVKASCYKARDETSEEVDLAQGAKGLDRIKERNRACSV